MVEATQARHFSDAPGPFPTEAMTTRSEDGRTSVSKGARYVKDGVSVRWIETYREEFGAFLTALDGVLADADHVRCVYWFEW